MFMRHIKCMSFWLRNKLCINIILFAYFIAIFFDCNLIFQLYSAPLKKARLAINVMLIGHANR